ncbi:MAG: allantoicase, partial [Pseudomonadota bacterium]
MASHPFGEWIDLAQPRLGTSVEFATDDFFADKRRLIDPADPVFIPDRYDDNGKWMDGWESRRKRTPGHDFCIVKLGVPGLIKGLEIDTSHFTGNYPPDASVDGCISGDANPGDDAGWQEILPTVPLRGDSRHFHPIDSDKEFTHLRLNIYPDGGVARLRVYGEIQPDWSNVAADDAIDLLALENGGKALMCNDEHFGTMHNLNAPGRGVNMADGWETARRRVPGNDWVILALGHPGTVDSVVIDTAHFKGNYPDRVSLRAALLDATSPPNLAGDSLAWPELL